MSHLKFVFISHCKDIAFFNPVKEGMREAGRLFNINVDFTGTEDIDIEEQKFLLEKAINENVDGICLTVTHKDAFDDLIEKALSSGIPVVCFNTDASKGIGKQLSSIVQDSYAAGTNLGNFMAEMIQEGSKALLTLHSDGIDSLESRKKGIMDALSEKGIQWRFITTGNGSEEARKRIKEFLQKEKGISYIFATGQDDTIGAGQAIQDLDLCDSVTVSGFDISPLTKKLIKQKVIMASVDQQPYAQGFYPVVQLFLYIKKRIAPSNIDAGSNIITIGDFV
ncbi:MAG: hypothetical protein B6241_10730 [Spirochaetaceae bacterium 4572_59]|nr:MAG: hypothetical protein B6241_10730 [Spirochaetaceae bacterium 4572_59]